MGLQQICTYNYTRLFIGENKMWITHHLHHPYVLYNLKPFVIPNNILWPVSGEKRSRTLYTCIHVYRYTPHVLMYYYNIKIFKLHIGFVNSYFYHHFTLYDDKWYDNLTFTVKAQALHYFLIRNKWCSIFCFVPTLSSRNLSLDAHTFISIVRRTWFFLILLSLTSKNIVYR